MPTIMATAETLASNFTGFHMEIGPCMDGIKIPMNILSEQRVAGDNEQADESKNHRLMPFHAVSIDSAFLESLVLEDFNERGPQKQFDELRYRRAIRNCP